VGGGLLEEAGSRVGDGEDGERTKLNGRSSFGSGGGGRGGDSDRSRSRRFGGGFSHLLSCCCNDLDVVRSKEGEGGSAQVQRGQGRRILELFVSFLPLSFSLCLHPAAVPIRKLDESARAAPSSGHQSLARLTNLRVELQPFSSSSTWPRPNFASSSISTHLEGIRSLEALDRSGEVCCVEGPKLKGGKALAEIRSRREGES